MKRITARVRHGRRQQHIHLPPSGLGTREKMTPMPAMESAFHDTSQKRLESGLLHLFPGLEIGA